MITVAQFIPGIKDAGAETLVKDYVTMIDRNKFRSVVIVLRNHPESANEKIIRDSGIPIIPLYKSWDLKTRIFKKLFGRWYIPYKLKRIILGEHCDVLHAHLHYVKYVRSIGKSIRDIKVLFTCHTLPSKYFAGKKNELRTSVEYLLKYNSLQLIAISNQIRLDLNEMFKIDNTIYLPNGIDFDRFQNIKKSKDDIRSEIGIPSEAFLLTQTGRLNDNKNQLFSLEVFRVINKRKENSKLLLIGDGEAKNIILAKSKDYGLSDDVIILSHRSDVPELLKASDCFIFPSKYEGLGIAFIEAQVVGIRCVAADTITPDAFITNKSLKLSLEDPAEKWADFILDDTLERKPDSSMESFNMRSVIHNLELIYTKSN